MIAINNEKLLNSHTPTCELQNLSLLCTVHEYNLYCNAYNSYFSITNIAYKYLFTQKKKN